MKKSINKIAMTSLIAAMFAGCLSGCGKPVDYIECPAYTPTPYVKAEVTQVPNTAITSNDKVQLLGGAQYPEQAAYPDVYSEKYIEELEAWKKSREYDDIISYDKEMQTFCKKLIPVMNEIAEGKNVIYSPMNLWFALSLLAETTGGETQQQILKVLGTNQEALSKVARSMWLSNYSDDGIVTSTLGNSIWLRNDTEYVKDKVDKLAKEYYASTYAGQMGSKEYSAALQKWLNENTGNLLEREASQVEFTPDVVFALASTIYFKAPWSEGFNERDTVKQTFHGVDGDKQFDFLKRKEEGILYKGKGFTAYRKRFAQQGGYMWLILPDEGITPEQMIAAGEYEKLLFGNENKLDYVRGDINLSVPKFDVTFNADVIDALEKMGIVSACNSGADFSPIMGAKADVALSQALHAARVKIDEEGVEAAAYTVFMMKNAALMNPNEVIDFTVDRPFVFIVANNDNVPTFFGTVNTLE